MSYFTKEIERGFSRIKRILTDNNLIDLKLIIVMQA
jgi:hypothetical protein